MVPPATQLKCLRQQCRATLDRSSTIRKTQTHMIDGVLDALFVTSDDKDVFVFIVIALISGMGPAIAQHVGSLLYNQIKRNRVSHNDVCVQVPRMASPRACCDIPSSGKESARKSRPLLLDRESCPSRYRRSATQHNVNHTETPTSQGFLCEHVATDNSNTKQS